MNYQLQSLKPSFITTLRGLFTDPIAYAVNWILGNYEQFWGKWEGQKKYGLDYNVCWGYAGIERSESELQMLWKQGKIPQETIDWAKANHYIDSDGDWFMARRWITTLSGKAFGGNDEANFYILAQKYGLIPDAMFPFRDDQQGYEYFDPKFITDEMRAMGQEFLKRFKIEQEELGGPNARYTLRSKDMINTALKQAPLQIGVPVPKNIWAWNNDYVKWDGSTNAAHSVELSGLTDKGEYIIYDQYEPCRKLLSPDYFIPLVTRAVITPIWPDAPIVVPMKKSVWELIWLAIAKYRGFNSIDPQVSP